MARVACTDWCRRVKRQGALQAVRYLVKAPFCQRLRAQLGKVNRHFSNDTPATASRRQLGYRGWRRVEPELIGDNCPPGDLGREWPRGAARKTCLFRIGRLLARPAIYRRCRSSQPFFNPSYISPPAGGEGPATLRVRAVTVNCWWAPREFFLIGPVRIKDGAIVTNRDHTVSAS